MQTLLIFAVTAFAIFAATMADGEIDALRAVAQSTSEFSDNFFKVLANETSGNLISSPLSAQVVLAMAAYGAGGATANQMRSALHIPAGDDEPSLSGYKSLIENLNSVKRAELHRANEIYIANGSAVKPTYKQLIAEKFLSVSQELDFNNGEAAASTINSWCLEQTNNRIKDVITPDSLTSDTKLVLVNAVYFKGQWAEKFNPALTRDRVFHVDVRTTKSVPTMFIKRRFRYGNLPEINARFIELLYQGNELSMIIILPNEVDGLKRVEDNFHQSILTENLSRVSPSEVNLYLPKIKIESKFDLKETLEKMGMTDMFQSGADFSGIADIPLKISQVIQKASIEVNEDGSEAAVVTGIELEVESLLRTEEIKVDRPFLYLIVHRATNSPLFVGQIRDPTLV